MKSRRQLEEMIEMQSKTIKMLLDKNASLLNRLEQITGSAQLFNRQRLSLIEITQGTTHALNQMIKDLTLYDGGISRNSVDYQTPEDIKR